MYNKPLAIEGLTSYRYKGPFGYIMIGAIDTKDAIGEARRSTTAPERSRLEVWDGKQYVSVDQ